MYITIIESDKFSRFSMNSSNSERFFGKYTCFENSNTSEKYYMSGNIPSPLLLLQMLLWTWVHFCSFYWTWVHFCAQLKDSLFLHCFNWRNIFNLRGLTLIQMTRSGCCHSKRTCDERCKPKKKGENLTSWSRIGWK